MIWVKGAATAFEDFSSIEVEPEFVEGRAGLHAAPAEIGMAMFCGTEEGPGLPRSLLRQVIARVVRPKSICCARYERHPRFDRG